MYQSKLFGEPIKNPPPETSISARLLLRGAFIEKLSSGVYNFLPLGFLALKNIEKIVREEMKKIGGQEILLASLHPKDLWEKTGRWGTMDDLYKLKENKKEWALGPTHEEVIVPLAKKFIRSYRDLPLALFQIQTKFRKELRAKAGLLRTKEFLMKDLYSFHESEEDLNEYYERVRASYFRIFKRVGIDSHTFFTFASGGTFSKFSHEFQTICESGEDTIFICKGCRQAINKEIKDKVAMCPNCGGKNFEVAKSIEVGNIFKLMTKFSEPFDLSFIDRDGNRKFVIMGCYGIGLGRLLATIVEVNHDSKGIIWPHEVSPFLIHFIPIGDVKREANIIYGKISKHFTILYDDRLDKSPGEKFFDADLLGFPIRLVLSEKTSKKKEIEIKLRKSNRKKMVKISSIIPYLKECCKKY